MVMGGDEGISRPLSGREIWIVGLSFGLGLGSGDRHRIPALLEFST